MAGKYDHLFKKMQEANVGNGEYAERLGLGEHAVQILHYIAKDGNEDGGSGVIIETEVEILESSAADHIPGSTRGWAWWPEAGKHPKYSQARAMQFVAACAESIGDTRATAEVAGDLIGDDQPARGLILIAQVTRGKPHKENAGEFYHNIKWTAVPQTAEALASQRAALEQAKPALAAAVAAKMTQAAAPPAPAPRATGGASGFLRKTTAATAATALTVPTTPAPSAPAGSILGGFRRG